MKVFISSKRMGVQASGEYNPETNTLVVFAGSILSKEIKRSEKFRGANSIEKARKNNLDGCVLQHDMTFTSASTAGNFVTGRSTNGLIVWKNKDGITLKELLSRS